jgi:hypothetical protein
VKISKHNLEAAAGTLVAVAAAVQSALVAKGLESADNAAAISSGLAVLLGGYHGGAVAATKARTATPVAAETAAPSQPVTEAPGAADTGSVLA